jgi:hypothetical protein
VLKVVNMLGLDFDLIDEGGGVVPDQIGHGGPFRIWIIGFKS